MNLPTKHKNKKINPKVGATKKNYNNEGIKILS